MLRDSDEGLAHFVPRTVAAFIVAFVFRFWCSPTLPHDTLDKHHLQCPQCHHEMRIVSLINDAQIIERILRHIGMWVSEVWNNGVRIAPGTGPPVGESVAAARIIDRGQLVIEPWLDDQMPDYDCGI